MAAARKTYTVNWPGGVCVREKASKDGKVLAVLPCGEKVTIDPKTETEPGWVAVSGGGYTMAQYLK